jgi:hypothetical protein
MKKHELLIPVFLSFILLIWVINFGIIFLENRFRENALPVTVTFIEDKTFPELAETNERSGADHYIVVYEFNGTNYKETLKGVNDLEKFTTSSGSKPRPGATAEALVDPKNPSTVYIKEVHGSYTGVIIISILLLGILGLTRFFKK